MAEEMIYFQEPGMRTEEIMDKLKSKFALEEIEIPEEGNLSFSTTPDKIKQICRYMLYELGFEHIIDLTAVDYRKNLEMVYHIRSYQNHCIVKITVEIPSENSAIDTVSDIWGGANWHEREAYDMFGITFKGHPDLRRILLPEELDIHPLRKSFKMSKDKTWNVKQSGGED